MKLIFSILILLLSTCFAQKISPFNGLEIETDSSRSYSFIVSGHFYGSSSNATGYPTNTLLANIDNINSSKSSFLICLGDLFMDVSNDIPNYKKSFFSQLNIPLFNSVGNHDLTGDIYQNNFGETTNLFQVENDLHLILDSERDNGNMEDDQLSMLKEALTKTKSGTIKNVFIYGHRTLWVDSYPEMEGLFTTNTQSITANNFETKVLPLLKEIGQNTSVYWFAGSLGDAPASFFYHADEAANITYIATAIRGLKRDAFLHINSNEGEVSFELESLTNQELKQLQDYDVNYWQENVGKEEPFNWRLAPLYVKNILLHRYFYYGLFSCIAFFFLSKFIKGLIRKKKA